jgi:hypothetical protein
MKDFRDLSGLVDKKLRTLRNNLNNRLETFKKDANAKDLPASHMLHGLDLSQCKDLLLKVQTEMKKRSKA